MTLAPQAWPSLDGQIPPDTIGYIWLPFTDFRSDYDYRHRFNIVHSCSGIHWITAVVQEEKKADTYRQVLGILDGFSRLLFRSSLLLRFFKTLSDWSWTAKVLKETLILGILVRIQHDFIKARLMYTKGLVELCGLHVIVARCCKPVFRAVGPKQLYRSRVDTLGISWNPDTFWNQSSATHAGCSYTVLYCCNKLSHFLIFLSSEWDWDETLC